MLGVKVELQEHKIISDKHIIKFIDALSSMGYDTLVLDSNLVSKECMKSTSIYCELKGINFLGGAVRRKLLHTSYKELYLNEVFILWEQCKMEYKHNDVDLFQDYVGKECLISVPCDTILLDSPKLFQMLLFMAETIRGIKNIGWIKYKYEEIFNLKWGKFKI